MITQLEDIRWDGPTVLTLGKFDGLHRGHRTLLDRVLLKARKTKASSLVFSLGIGRESLLSVEEKRQMLEELSVDGHIECPFIPALITMEATDFVRQMLVGRLHVCHIVVGEGFRFGFGRRGDAGLLRQMGEMLGFTVDVLPKLLEDGERVSSTRIRSLLSEGRMEEAARLLGYPFFVSGDILHGRRLGRTIGFPTTNLLPPPEKTLPPKGVYFSRSTVAGQAFCGITDIGTKPTVGGSFVGVESHLFGMSKELYGKRQKVELLHFSRPEKKFEDLEALKTQISTDMAMAREHFGLEEK